MRGLLPLNAVMTRVAIALAVVIAVAIPAHAQDGALFAGPATTSKSATTTLRAGQSSKKKVVLAGLGIGLAAGAVTVAVKCHGGSERGDCYRAGWILVVPAFSVGGAVVGLMFAPTSSSRPSIAMPSHTRAAARRSGLSLAVRF